jgi:hypothetical protein
MARRDMPDIDDQGVLHEAEAALRVMMLLDTIPGNDEVRVHGGVCMAVW